MVAWWPWVLQTWVGTREERWKERCQVVGKCVGIVKSTYCIYWLYHYRIKDKHKAHVSWAGGDHWEFFSSVAWWTNCQMYWFLTNGYKRVTRLLLICDTGPNVCVNNFLLLRTNLVTIEVWSGFKALAQAVHWLRSALNFEPQHLNFTNVWI